ncbi:MAG: NYN domain-containing protein [Verrucomicrobiales bacterium]
MTDSTGRLKALFVDGHSIIFAWEDLRALHERNPMLAREELCRRMTVYQDTMQQRVVVVFDGKGEKTQAKDGSTDDIVVIYSGKGKTADDVIERLVAQYSERYELTVATGDRAEMDTVMAFGGFCITPRTLLEYLDRAEAQLASTLARLRKK